MKNNNRILKKMLCAAAAFVLFTAGQVHADFLNISGEVEWVVDSPNFVVTTGSPVSLYLEWEAGAVSGSGESILTFNPSDAVVDHMTFSVGSIFSIDETDRPGTVIESPITATFNNGILQEFELLWFPVDGDFDFTIDGLAGVFWSLTIQPTVDPSKLAVFTIEQNLAGDYWGGSLNPVPLPGAVWLFGSGLIGLVGIRRRWRMRS